jgi:hypothetical protein
MLMWSLDPKSWRLWIMANSLASRETLSEIVPPGVAIISRYLRVQQVLDFYPFKRAKLYELLARGDIKSFSLKEKGALRGLRLINRDSIDQFLEAKAAEASATPEVKTSTTKAEEGIGEISDFEEV